MHLAVCGNCAQETEQICSWITQYCQASGCAVGLWPVRTPEQLRQECVSAAFIGFDDTTAFLAARELRDRDRNCRIIIINDTSRYAIRCHRIHALYFIVRPLKTWHIVRSMELILGRRAY